MPSVLLIGGLLTAALVSAAALLATAAVAIGNDLYVEFIESSAPEGRRIFIARLSMIGLALCAAALCRATGDDVALLAGSGLSIGAASLGPLLLVGWPIRNVGPTAAVAAISVGLWLTVADIALALLFPDVAGRFLGMGTIAPTVLGPTGWFGLPVALSGMTGVIFGIITLWAVTELPRTDWRKLGLRLRHAGLATVSAARNAAEQVRSKQGPDSSTPEPVPAIADPIGRPLSTETALVTGPRAIESSTLSAESAAGPTDKPAS
jgi:Na+(H+)/acetate symporter ActP